MREYILYIREEPKLEEPIEVELRDKDTRERLNVQAIITTKAPADPEKEGYHKVWLWEVDKYKAREPHWWVKILKPLEEEEEEVRPRVRPTRRPGGLLRSLIEKAQEEE